MIDYNLNIRVSYIRVYITQQQYCYIYLSNIFAILIQQQKN